MWQCAFRTFSSVSFQRSTWNFRDWYRILKIDDIVCQNFFPLSRSSAMIFSRLVEGEKFIESNLNKFSLSSTVLVTFWVILSILSLFYITKPKLLQLSCSEGNKEIKMCYFVITYIIVGLSGPSWGFWVKLRNLVVYTNLTHANYWIQNTVIYQQFLLFHSGCFGKVFSSWKKCCKEAKVCHSLMETQWTRRDISE